MIPLRKYAIAFGGTGFSAPFLMLALLSGMAAILSSTAVFGRRVKEDDRAAKPSLDLKTGSPAGSSSRKAIQIDAPVQHRVIESGERTQRLGSRPLENRPFLKLWRMGAAEFDTDRLLKDVADLIRKALGYSQVNIYLTDRSRNQLILHASSGPANTVNKVFEINAGSMNGKAALLDLCEIVNDTNQPPAHFSSGFLPGTCSEMAAPLHVEDKMIGTLDVHSPRSNAFAVRDICFLQRLGEQIAVTIENARLYQLTRRNIALGEGNRPAQDMKETVSQCLSTLGKLIESQQRVTT